MNAFIEANANILLPVALLIGLAAVAAVIVLGLQLRKMTRPFSEMAGLYDDIGTEKSLKLLLKGVDENREFIRGHSEDLKVVLNKIEGCFKGIGMVKYNAFEDIGGNQSYSICILTREKNGFMMTNLVGNALKFTESGAVTVRVATQDDMVVFRVEDSGVGLTPEETRSVFEKFVQVGRTHGAGIKGTGLGLAISRQIVGLHGGKIWAESEKGQGSAFIFSLPIYNEANVIGENIAQVIEEAREAQEGFILLLFEIVRGESAEADFRTGYTRLLETQEHVRTTDLVIPRGGNQVLLLANVRPDQIGILYRRWESQVAASFMDAGALDVGLRCGYAEYPNDGSDAAGLLTKAGKTLSDMGKLGLESKA